MLPAHRSIPANAAVPGLGLTETTGRGEGPHSLGKRSPGGWREGAAKRQSSNKTQSQRKKCRTWFPARHLQHFKLGHLS